MISLQQVITAAKSSLIERIKGKVRAGPSYPLGDVGAELENANIFSPLLSVAPSLRVGAGPGAGGIVFLSESSGTVCLLVHRQHTSVLLH